MRQIQNARQNKKASPDASLPKMVHLTHFVSNTFGVVERTY
jgi:hypothetical protein